MNTMFLAAQAQQGGGMSMILMMVALFAIMYFFMIRPQQKKQKEIKNFQNSLAEGTEVITGGGIIGTIRRVNLEDGTVDLEISRGVIVKADRNYVFAIGTTQPTK